MSTSTEHNKEFDTSHDKPSIFKMVLSPTSQFTSIKENPLILRPLITLLFLQILTYISVGFLSADDKLVDTLKSLIDISDTRIQIIVAIFITLSGIVNTFFTVVIVAIVIKLFMIFFQNNLSFQKIISLLVHITLIPLIGLFANVLINIGLQTSNFTSFTNLGIFFEENSILKDIFSSLDLFFIIQIVLISIGLKIIGNLSKTKVISIGVFLFAVNLCFSIISALLT